MSMSQSVDRIALSGNQGCYNCCSITCQMTVSRSIREISSDGRMNRTASESLSSAPLVDTGHTRGVFPPPMGVLGPRTLTPTSATTSTSSSQPPTNSRPRWLPSSTQVSSHYHDITDYYSQRIKVTFCKAGHRT